MNEEFKKKVQYLFNTGFFHIFGSNVICKIVGFLSSVVLVRIVSKAEYGLFTYAWNIYNIVIIFNGMGIENGILQLASEHGKDTSYTEKIAKYGSSFGLRFNIILVLVMIGIGLFAPLSIEKGRNLILLLAFLPMIQLLSSITTVYLRAQKKNKEFSNLNVIMAVATLVLSTILAYFFHGIGLVAGHYVSSLLVFTLGLLCYQVRILSRDRIDIGSEKTQLLKISFISMCNNGLSQLMYLIDVFVLGIVDPQETILASYKVATTIPAALTFIPLALMTYLYPYFAEHKDDKRWCLDKYKKVLLSIGVVNLLISSILFITAPLVVRLLYGIQYLDAVPVFRILSINYLISGTFRIISGNLLVTQRKLKFNLYTAILSSSINIIADYFFIQWWGSIGAAYATMLVVIVSSILSTSYLIRTFKGKVRNE